MVSGKIHHGWRKNLSPLADILALAENSVLYSVTIFQNNSATGRLWSCGTPSLAWNYLESFLQCRPYCPSPFYLKSFSFGLNYLYWFCCLGPNYSAESLGPDMAHINLDPVEWANTSKSLLLDTPYSITVIFISTLIFPGPPAWIHNIFRPSCLSPYYPV
jgi:hypothetical protein